MDFAHVEPVVRAVLYEGYILYPYRASSRKNQYRWTFGGLHTRRWCDVHPEERWQTTAEGVVVGTAQTAIIVSVRFLQLAPATRDDGSAWQEAVERRVDVRPRPVGELVAGAREQRFAFALGEGRGGELRGTVTMHAALIRDGVYRLSATVTNDTEGDASDNPARALECSFASVHLLFGAVDGSFVSLVDPPPELHDAVDACTNVGVWPVLAGMNTMLASPIILGDHPGVAPESPGDLFDATEIDEILTLRILTLTNDEKAEVRRLDPRARAILERAESLGPEAVLAMHGASRRGPNDTHASLRQGARVKLRPKNGGDIFDLALAGRTATVSSVETDVDGGSFVTVTVDDDPGRDLGALGQPGHRFFFRADEVEILP